MDVTNEQVQHLVRCVSGAPWGNRVTSMCPDMSPQFEYAKVNNVLMQLRKIVLHPCPPPILILTSADLRLREGRPLPSTLVKAASTIASRVCLRGIFFSRAM